MDEHNHDQPARRRRSTALLDHPHIRNLVAGQLGHRIQELHAAHARNGDGHLPDPAAHRADDDLANLLADVVSELRAG